MTGDRCPACLWHDDGSLAEWCAACDLAWCEANMPELLPGATRDRDDDYYNVHDNYRADNPRIGLGY